MQAEFGKHHKSKFNTFKQNRHRMQTDAERRAEREKKFGKYKPGPDSGFNKKNRAYHKVEGRSHFEYFVKGQSMFKINRDNHAKEFHGFNQGLNQSFD